MIEQDIYDNLRAAFVLLAWRTQDVLRPYQLTIAQFDTLLTLETGTGWRMGDLTQKILSDNSKMTRIVDYLEHNSWAERRPDPVDRRAQQVFLTESGATFRAEVQQRHGAALRHWLADFSDDQKDQLQSLLTQFQEQMREQFSDS
jgi:DNA-binding MarR family transcriptional regulator